MGELGWTEADVVVFEGTDDEARALALALNRSAEHATWDQDILADALKSLNAELQAAAGWMDKELRDIVGSDVDEPMTPPTPLNPATKHGDLWLLGEHRLLCGDASKDDQVDRLLAGAEIHLVNTDPPYNVKVEPRSNNAIAAGLSSFTATHHQGLDLARHPEPVLGGMYVPGDMYDLIIQALRVRGYEIEPSET